MLNGVPSNERSCGPGRWSCILWIALSLVPLAGFPTGTGAQTCDPEYCSNGSSGSCAWTYCQEYCDTGSYCDCTVQVCDSGSGMSMSESCSCY